MEGNTLPKATATVALPRDVEPIYLFGERDRFLRRICSTFGVEVSLGPAGIGIRGEPDATQTVQKIFSRMVKMVQQGEIPDEMEMEYLLDPEGSAEEEQKGVQGDEAAQGENLALHSLRLKHARVKPKTDGQARYIQSMKQNDIVFSIGPAGTGKTYLAVGMAIEALKAGRVERIILTRPAVEAGESLGFLPGTLFEKVDPYLRPLYDAIFDMISPERFQVLREKEIIEIAPLAYMRGRTLNNSFIILDEAQNTTHPQMKMFLTRIGFHSKAVITGDITQIDLKKDLASGLMECESIFKGIEGIDFVYLDRRDVVRHPLVKKIIAAYEAFEQSGEA